jgi:hypothetical protein
MKKSFLYLALAGTLFVTILNIQGGLTQVTSDGNLAFVSKVAVADGEGGDSNKQYISTECYLNGVYMFNCNNCDSGSNTCTDHTCNECEPQQ